jgi:hypothetical protein
LLKQPDNQKSSKRLQHGRIQEGPRWNAFNDGVELANVFAEYLGIPDGYCRSDLNVALVYRQKRKGVKPIDHAPNNPSLAASKAGEHLGFSSGVPREDSGTIFLMKLGTE